MIKRQKAQHVIGAVIPLGRGSREIEVCDIVSG